MRLKINIKYNILLLLLAVIATSFYLFPIGFKGLPESLNTKQMLAVVGVLIFAVKCVRDQSIKFRKPTLVAFAIACLFSLWCYFCTVVNGTSDNSYALYILSFAVWLGGAYATCCIIKLAYGNIDLRILARVLAFVCVAQCVSALLVDNVPAFQKFVDTWIIQDTVPKEVGRMYGLGISLDSGAVRMNMALLLIAHQLATRTKDSHNALSIWTYYLAFFFIVIVGSMIARTTWVGMALGLLYIFIRRVLGPMRNFSRGQIIAFFGTTIVVVGAIVWLVHFYNTDYTFRNYMRFGFEGFFNLFETGEFTTDSTERLNEVMWVWPWTTKGWIIGYGHFADWPTFLSDIGYCRFTLYCGLIGMAIFSAYFIYLAVAMAGKFENVNLLCLLLFALTFIVWIKVATDIFQLYALLLCLPATKVLQTQNDD